VYERFTRDARRVLVVAQTEVRELGHQMAGTEHLLLALTKVDAWVGDLLQGLGVTHDSILDHLAPGKGSPDVVPVGADWRAVLDAATREADTQGRQAIGAEHLLLGVLDAGGAGVVCLDALGQDVASLRATLLAVGTSEVVDDPLDPGPMFPLAPPMAILEGDVLAKSAVSPRCASCHRPLADGVRHLRVPVDIEVTVDLVYCGHCGETLTTRIVERG
jgi:hypothetical protein